MPPPTIAPTPVGQSSSPAASNSITKVSWMPPHQPDASRSLTAIRAEGIPPTVPIDRHDYRSKKVLNPRMNKPFLAHLDHYYVNHRSTVSLISYGHSGRRYQRKVRSEHTFLLPSRNNTLTTLLMTKITRSTRMLLPRGCYHRQQARGARRATISER